MAEWGRAWRMPPLLVVRILAAVLGGAISALVVWTAQQFAQYFYEAMAQSALYAVSAAARPEEALAIAAVAQLVVARRRVGAQTAAHFDKAGGMVAVRTIHPPPRLVTPSSWPASRPMSRVRPGCPPRWSHRPLWRSGG